jgi:single-stranded DNA-binding protein
MTETETAMAIEAAFFGTLGRDAEAKTSKAGKPYLRLNIRVGDGDALQWVNCTSFDSEAVAAAERLVKGAKVYVEGRLTLDEWTSNDGTQRHGLSVMSFHTRIAQIGRNKPPKRDDDDASTAPSQGAQRSHANDLNDAIPF